MRFIRSLAACRRGTTVIEYGLICALVVLAIFAALSTFAGKVVGVMFTVSNAVVNAS